MRMKKVITYDFFAIPLYFYDYGLQVFSHIEYDLLGYILRNTIGFKRLEFEASIKKIALIKHYSEKNIIKAINSLIEKTGVFNKIVFRENGSLLKKTKYYITENSVNILNDYVKKNMPKDFNEKMGNLKTRTMEAEEKLQKGKEELLKRQRELLPIDDNTATNDTNNADNSITIEETMNYDLEELPDLLKAYQEIINDFSIDIASIRYSEREENESLFKLWKMEKYNEYGITTKETDDEKINIQLGDLTLLTDDQKTIGFYNSLVENKKFSGKQEKFFYETLKINFGIWNEANFDRINIIFV
jgi:hypothetical protein